MRLELELDFARTTGGTRFISAKDSEPYFRCVYLVRHPFSRCSDMCSTNNAAFRNL